MASNPLILGSEFRLPLRYFGVCSKITLSVADLKEVFEHDPGLVNSGMEFWTEIVK